MCKSVKTLIGVLALAVLSANAQAVVVYSENFDAAADAASVGWDGGYIFQATSISRTISTTGGVGGSPGFDMTADTTYNPPSSTFWLAATQFYSGTMAMPVGATAATTSFTASVAGNYTGEFFLSLRSNSDASNYITFYSTVVTPGVYQSVGGTLDTATIDGTGLDLTASGGYSIYFGFADNSGWGQGPGRTLLIDNVLVQTVPEPSTLTLLGVALLGGFYIKRSNRVS